MIWNLGVSGFGSDGFGQVPALEWYQRKVFVVAEGVRQEQNER